MKAKEERNYHIFYCVLAGLSNDERNKLKLTKAADYAYLNKVSVQIFCLAATTEEAVHFRVHRNAILVMMPKNGKRYDTLAKCSCLPMENCLKSSAFFRLFFIWEIFSTPVSHLRMAVQTSLFRSLAQSSKGIDGVSIKDPKLVEFIASMLEVRGEFLNEHGNRS